MSKLPAVLQQLKFPVIASPLFIISNPKLVIAQCKAGVVGSMPALNARPAEQLEEWLIEITEALAAHNHAHPDKPAAPFAINQIVHKSNDRLEYDMAMCVKYKVPIIITSLGAREDVNAAAHSYGRIVLHDIINNQFAKKAIEKGADGGLGAGLAARVPEIRREPDCGGLDRAGAPGPDPRRARSGGQGAVSGRTPQHRLGCRQCGVADADVGFGAQGRRCRPDAGRSEAAVA